MNILHINKTNITSCEFDEVTEKWNDIDIDELNYPLSRYFSQVVEVSEDLTVEDLMSHINKHSEIINLCFYSYLGGESVIPFCELSKEEPDNKHISDTLELFWTNDLIEDEYFLYGTFHGIITNKENYNEIEANRSNSFTLDLTPINNWKHCKILLNDTIKASTVDEEDQTHIMKLKNKWTFFEFLQYFLYEITYYGSIEKQKQEFEKFELDQKKYDTFRVDPDFAEKLDKEEVLSFIDGITQELELAQDSLEMAVEEDDFESAKEIKEEIDELNLELSKMKKRLKNL